MGKLGRVGEGGEKGRQKEKHRHKSGRECERPGNCAGEETDLRLWGTSQEGSMQSPCVVKQGAPLTARSVGTS